MKRQLLVAQLAVLFEKSTAQHRLRRQTLPARLRDRLSARIGRHQTQKIAMGVQSLRHRLQLTTDLGLGEKIEYAALDGAFLAHCRLRRLRVCLYQWLDAKVYLNPPGLARTESAFPQ